MFIELKYKPHSIEQQNWDATFGILIGQLGLDYIYHLFDMFFIQDSRN